MVGFPLTIRRKARKARFNLFESKNKREATRLKFVNLDEVTVTAFKFTNVFYLEKVQWCDENKISDQRSGSRQDTEI